MPLDPDLLSSKPKTESEWLLQPGEDDEIGGTIHIVAVQNAIEELDPMSRLCVEAVFYEGISYNTLGKRLGVSKVHAWRLARKAMAELQRKLSVDHSINLRYNMFDSWNEAAGAILTEWSTLTSGHRANHQHLNAYRKTLARAVRERREIPRLDIIDVAHEAMSELKAQKQWNAGEMHDLLVRKQRDYGHENILMFGHVGIAIRMCDKLARLDSLLTSGATPSNESLVDTWMDLIGYAVISEMLYLNVFELELEDE
jgi:predicted DNA-binding protein (UPF0251 family)